MAVMGSDRGYRGEGRRTATTSELLTGRNGHNPGVHAEGRTGGMRAVWRGGRRTGLTLEEAAGGGEQGVGAVSSTTTGQSGIGLRHTDPKLYLTQTSNTTHMGKHHLQEPWRRNSPPRPSSSTHHDTHIHRLLLTFLLSLLCSTTLSTASQQHSPSSKVDSNGHHHRPRRDLPPPLKDNTDTPPVSDPTTGTQEESGFSQEDDMRLRQFVEHVRSPGCRDVPSVALSWVRRQGEKRESWAVGKADIERGVAATPRTQYCVASLSKAFTATLLVKLLDRKGRSLDDSVTDILRGKYPFMDEYVTSHVTVRDLLLHRTGIPRYDYLWISGAPDASAIFRRLRCMKHKHEFRSEALYNNILYALAGHVAEEVGGASWEELVKIELLDPLGMTSTTFIKDIYSGPFNNTKAEQYAWHQDGMNGRNINIGDPIHRGAADITPAIGVYSTAEDMERWMDFHLSRGRNRQGHQLIPGHLMDDMHRGQVSAEKMMKPEMVLDDKSKLLTYDMYGLAWYTGYHRGHRVVMHFGSYPGFYSMITLLPDKGFGIFSTINGGRMERPFTINSAIHTYAIDLALDVSKDHTELSDKICRVNQMTTMPANCNDELGKYTLPSRHLARYTGIYANAAYGNISMVEKEGILYMMFNDIHFVASPLDDTTFCIVPTKKEEQLIFFPQNISFTSNSYQELESIAVHFLGFDNIFSKLPPDITYDEWIDEKCGIPQDPCQNGEQQLPAVQAKANTMSAKIYFVCIMLGISLLL